MSADTDRSIITTASGHSFQPGDIISFEVMDTRWWRRLLFWLLRRDPPRRTIKRRVTRVTSDTTAEL